MEFNLDTSRSKLELLESDLLRQHGVRLYIKRDDLIDSEISGNKWRKLKYNILQCVQQRNQGVMTFGGAYSNHLVATAAACQKAGILSVGVVRGNELNPHSNETLRRCSALGMQLHFVSREDYMLREDRSYLEFLSRSFPNYYTVPEGGANYLGCIGCQEMVREVPVASDLWVVAQGTTTTSCGIALGLQAKQQLAAIPVLKGFDSKSEMKQLLNRSGLNNEMTETLLDKIQIWDAYHFGGYAKYDATLIEFIQDFYRAYRVPLDPIYTGKALFGLMDQITQGNLDGKTIVFVHTGGLQGIKAIEKKEQAILHPEN